MRIVYRDRRFYWARRYVKNDHEVDLPVPHEHDHVTGVRAYLRGVSDAQAWFVGELDRLTRELASAAAELAAWHSAAARRPTNVRPR